MRVCACVLSIPYSLLAFDFDMSTPSLYVIRPHCLTLDNPSDGSYCSKSACNCPQCACNCTCDTDPDTGGKLAPVCNAPDSPQCQCQCDDGSMSQYTSPGYCDCSSDPDVPQPSNKVRFQSHVTVPMQLRYLLCRRRCDWGTVSHGSSASLC
jgi:hypothetical protein